MKSPYKYHQLLELPSINNLSPPRKHQRPIKKPSQERLEYLWSRVRRFASTIGRLSKISKDIQLFGSKKHIYSRKLKRETFDEFAPEKLPRFVMDPKAPFRKFWSLVIMVLLLYTITVTPYVIAFIEKEGEVLTIIGYVVDSLFAVDIIVTFFSAYRDEEGVFHKKKADIAKNYLKSWFFLDLVACFPFQLLSSEEDGEGDSAYNKLIRLLRLQRFSRLVRVLRLVKVLRVFKSNPCLKRVLTLLKATRWLLKLIKFCLMVMAIVHVVGCLWVLVAKLDNTDPNVWIVRFGYADSDNLTVYIAAVYWVFTTLTTVGYGDITPYTVFERMFTIILMAFGVAFYSYTITKLSTIMANLDKKKTMIEGSLSSLNDFSKAVKLPDDTKRKLRLHIRKTVKGKKMKTEDQEELLNQLPSSIRTKVSMHMHYGVVEKIYFLQDKDPGFISYIIPKLSPFYTHKREVLYREHDPAEEVYFLVAGTVDLLADNGLVFNTYIQGSYFGEIEVIEDTHRFCTARTCNGGAELLMMSSKKFDKMLTEFPKIDEEVREVAWIRSIKNKEEKDKVKLLRKSTVQFKPLPRSKTIVSPLLPEQKPVKIVEFRKRKNKNMWMELIEEKKQPPKSKEEWSLQPMQSYKIEPLVSLNPHGSKIGIVKKALERHPVDGKSKWNTVKANKKRILEMGSQKGIEIAGNLCVNSPLNTEEADSPSSHKLTLLKSLRNNLASHNLKLEIKVNTSLHALKILRDRSANLDLQINSLKKIAK